MEDVVLFLSLFSSFMIFVVHFDLFEWLQTRV